MRDQAKEMKNRVNRTGLHCVWTRSDRTPGAPLTARWVYDQPQTPNVTAMVFPTARGKTTTRA